MGVRRAWTGPWRARFSHPGVEADMAWQYQLFDEIGAGGQEPVLLGLLRNPFLAPDAVEARALWGDRIKQQRKTELAALDTQQENWLWAQSALLQLQPVLASSRSF